MSKTNADDSEKSTSDASEASDASVSFNHSLSSQHSWSHTTGQLPQAINKPKRLARRPLPSKGFKTLLHVDHLPAIPSSLVKGQTMDDQALLSPPRSSATKMIVALTKRLHQHIDAAQSPDCSSAEKIIHHSRLPQIEKLLQEQLLMLHENSDNIDLDVEILYHNKAFNLEQKNLLRDVVTKLFGTTISKAPEHPVVTACSLTPPSRPQGVTTQHWAVEMTHQLDQLFPGFAVKTPLRLLRGRADQCMVEVFALPVFGDVTSILAMTDDKATMNQLCQMLQNTGYVSELSDTVALLNTALVPQAMSQPSVLHALSSLWGSLIAAQEYVPAEVAQAVRRLVKDSLMPFAASGGQCGCVIPGVRVWKESSDKLNKSGELLSQWSRINSTKKMIFQTWWQLVCGNMLQTSSLDIAPGDVMIRPPVPPLVAQTQALSWHMVQQVYDRLGVRPFNEINVVSSSENHLILRAYHKQKIIAQSDAVALFDITGAADDFSHLIQNECEQSGPRSRLREQTIIKQ